MHENTDQRRFFITATQLQKLVATKLHCVECFNQRCIMERTNMQSAILSLAEVFDDVYLAYIAQEKVLAEIISKMNEFSVNFALQKHFSLPSTNNERINRLHRMAKMIRTLLLKPKNNQKFQTTQPTSSPGTSTQSFSMSHQVVSKSGMNCKSTRLSNGLMNSDNKRKIVSGPQILEQRNFEGTRLMNNTICHNTFDTTKSASLNSSPSVRSSNGGMRKTTDCVVQNGDSREFQLATTSSGGISQQSSVIYSGPTPTLNNSMSAKPDSRTHSQSLSSSPLSSKRVTKSSTLRSEIPRPEIAADKVAVVDLSDDDDGVVTGVTPKTNCSNSNPSSLTTLTQSTSFTTSSSGTAKLSVEGSNNCRTVAVHRKYINALPTVEHQSQPQSSSATSADTLASTTKELPLFDGSLASPAKPTPVEAVTNSKTSFDSTLLTSSALAPILDAIDRSSIKADLPALKNVDYLPPAKRFCAKATQPLNNSPAKTAQKYLSANGRYYVANSPIVFSSRIHPLPFPSEDSRVINSELVEKPLSQNLKRVFATMNYEDKICVLKFYVEYEALLSKKKFYLYYYLKNTANADPSWKIGNKFNCKPDGTLCMTMQFEDAREDEVLFFSSRIGTDDTSFISDFSTPIAIKLGKSNNGEIINVNFEALCKRIPKTSPASISVRSTNPDSNSAVEVIDLD